MANIGTNRSSGMPSKIVDGAGVEVHVNVDALGPIGPHDLPLQVGEDLEPLGLTLLLAQDLRTVSHVPRPRVFRSVDPVAEAHDSAAVIDDVAGVSLGVLWLADIQVPSS